MNISTTGRNRQSTHHADHTCPEDTCTETTECHPKMQRNPQTQSKHSLPTNHTYSVKTANPSQYTEVWSEGINFPNKSPFHQLQKLHLHVVPFQVFMNCLKVIRFSDDLMSSGRLFHKLAPSYLKLLRPYVV